MAKESLREHLNRRIKEKGSTLSKEKAKAKKYKSIAAAKKDGALYYTNKAGKVMAAVYATDLALKSSLKPKLRPKKSKPFPDVPEKQPLKKTPVKPKTRRDPPPDLKKIARLRKISGPTPNKDIELPASDKPKPEVKLTDVKKQPYGAARGGMMRVKKRK